MFLHPILIISITNYFFSPFSILFSDTLLEDKLKKRNEAISILLQENIEIKKTFMETTEC